MNVSEQEVLVQQIRDQYTEKKPTELDALKKLDAQVKAPAAAFAYAFGSLSALVMGAGMSLVQTDVGSAIGLKTTRTPGIVLGLAGMAMAIANYPIHKSFLENRKKEYAGRILELSDKILNK